MFGEREKQVYNMKRNDSNYNKRTVVSLNMRLVK